MKTGLTLGKYAPFHKGHEYVIETALTECDNVIALIYDEPDVTEIPVTVRADWIRDLYPDVDVRITWTGPREVGYTESIKQRHQDHVISVLDGIDVDVFYSSEPYGDHMSRALDADDHRVDQDRTAVPISGTEIRNNPYGNREFVDPRVYRDLLTNVAILGAPSTGKTTLARELATVFDTEWMPEYGQEYWDENNVDGELTPGQLLDIIDGHLYREDENLEQANQYLFTDTNAITTYNFCRDYHGYVPPRIDEMARRCAERYDVTILCDTDIPYDGSNGRRGERAQQRLQRMTIDFLSRHNIPYYVVTGSLDARIGQVREILATHTKYDLAGSV